MISPDLALWILTGLTILLVVVIPLLDSTEKLSKIISMRWTCVAVILIIMVAVVLDFNHLSDNTRDIILKGGLIVVGSFLAMRTVEKIMMKGYLKNLEFEGTLQKGDASAVISLKNNNQVSVDSKKVEDLPEISEENKKVEDLPEIPEEDNR